MLPTPAVRSRPLALLLLAGWTALVWWLLTGPSIRIGEGYLWGTWTKNLAHAPLFGGEAVFIGLALRPGRVELDSVGRRRLWLIAAFAALAYGIGMEWVQSHTPGRKASGLDVLTDAVGAFGVPWALASGAIVSARAGAVLGFAALAATLATLA